jgi:hypothetical protein
MIGGFLQKGWDMDRGFLDALWIVLNPGKSLLDIPEQTEKEIFVAVKKLAADNYKKKCALIRCEFLLRQVFTQEISPQFAALVIDDVREALDQE